MNNCFANDQLSEQASKINSELYEIYNLKEDYKSAVIFIDSNLPPYIEECKKDPYFQTKKDNFTKIPMDSYIHFVGMLLFDKAECQLNLSDKLGAYQTFQTIINNYYWGYYSNGRCMPFYVGRVSELLINQHNLLDEST